MLFISSFSSSLFCLRSHCFYYFQKLTSLAGVPRLNSPPPLFNTSTSNQERPIVTPRPIRVTPNLVTHLEDLSQPWTRSPTKSKMEPILATWHFISSDPLHADSSVVGMCPWLRKCIHSLFNISIQCFFPRCAVIIYYVIEFSHEATTDPVSFRDTIKLAPMPDSYDLDRGLLLAVQAIQVWSVI